MHIFSCNVYDNEKERWIHMDEKEKKQSFDEEFAPEISPGYRQDVHKQPKYKNTSFLMGITIFAAVLLVLIIFVYF